MATDFDRSFDYFEGKSDDPRGGDGGGGGAPALWSDNAAWDTNHNNAPAETSFDADAFEFAAESSTQLGDEQDSSSLYDPFAIGEAVTRQQQQQQHLNGAAGRALDVNNNTVSISVHEQLSALFDDISDGCQVEGTVYVKPVGELTGLPFCITLRDMAGELHKVDLQDAVAQDISDKVSRQALHRSDRVLRVRLLTGSNDGKGEETRIASYTCSPTLRPVPLVRAHPEEKKRRSRCCLLFCRPHEAIRLSRSASIPP